ncbi:MAG: type III-B CRISPR module RAMP protein Cmr1 [Anaerolineae bacterium]|nr:type III-B CRISPR module RAMP protein Cmr1 [Anaerolineae bacterium]
MLKLAMTLETVTPLFLGGAEPRKTPEIRAPSVRGVLRYWLRAALGGSNLSDLKTAEAQVFGDTSDGSAVVVRVRSEAQPFNYFESRMEPRRDDPSRKRRVFIHGEAQTTSYLFFSLDENRREKIDARWCYPVGAEIELEFIARRQDDIAWQRACGALWLLTHLGGLGARSRRGAGSLQARDGQQLSDWPPGLPALSVQARNALELVTKLNKGLTRLRQAFGAGGPMTAPTEFHTLAPQACRIWVLSPEDGWPSWSAALGAVAEALRQGRSSGSSYHQLDAVKQAVAAKQRLPAIGRAGLGLPIVFYDKETRSNVGTLQGDKIERRGSPLHVHVIKLHTEPARYAVVLIWFKARFAPAGSELALKSGQRTLASGDLPDPAWMDQEFWPVFDQNSGAQRLEVIFQ